MFRMRRRSTDRNRPGRGPSSGPDSARRGPGRSCGAAFRALALLAVFLHAAIQAPAAGAQEPPPNFLERTRWVSESDDISAIFVNPAGLAIGRGREGLAELSFERDEHSQGTFLLGFSFLKLGYVHDDVGAVDYDTYAFGAGLDASPFSFGWTVKLHRSDTQNGSKATAHDAGTLFRPVRYASLGFRMRNLNDPAFAGDRLPRGYTGAISVRPYLADPERFTTTLQSEWRRAEDKARFTLAGEYRIRDGLRVAAHYTTRIEEGGLALSVDFPRHTFRAAGVDGEGNGLSPGTGYSIHSHSDFRHNVFPVTRGFADIRIAGAYEDQASGFVLAGVGTKSGPRAVQVLKRVAEDEDVAGAIIRLGPLEGGFIGDVSAIHQEIREEILEIRKSGRPVVVFLEEGGGAAEAYIASAADHVVMPRLASFSGIGVAVEILRLKSAFADLGIDWESRTAGEYKSTFHSFYTDSSTAAQRREVEALVAEAYAELESTLVASRNLDAAARTEILSGGLVPAGRALDLKLIDEIGWYEDARRAASSLASGGSDPARLKSLERRRYWKERWTPPPAVAVVLAGGGIESGEGKVDRIFGGRTLGAETVSRAVRAAASNPSVKAIVLRVDTGGGSALGSDRIRRELIEVQRKHGLPIIVSMGNAAASGGYWISMDADRIVTNPLTVTGSIGVVNSKPVIARLLEKRHVNREVFKEGEHSDMFSAMRSMSEAERRQVDRQVNVIYDAFLDGVAEGRGLTRQQVESLAGGQVWLGRQAVKNGLADEIGTLEDAVKVAARAAGIEADHRILWYTGRRAGFLARLAEGVEYISIGAGALAGTADGSELP